MKLRFKSVEDMEDASLLRRLLENDLPAEEAITIWKGAFPDIAIWSWYGQLVLGKLYNAAEFLNVKNYTNVLNWAKEINNRPAVQRGKMVNKISGNLNFALRERHSNEDFKK